MTDETHDSTPTPPAGTTWMGEWDEQFGDRIYGADPIVIGDVVALLTGVQNRNGSTVSGVALRVGGTVVDLTPAQACEVADALSALAQRAEAIDGLA